MAAKRLPIAQTLVAKSAEPATRTLREESLGLAARRALVAAEADRAGGRRETDARGAGAELSGGVGADDVLARLRDGRKIALESTHGALRVHACVAIGGHAKLDGSGRGAQIDRTISGD